MNEAERAGDERPLAGLCLVYNKQMTNQRISD